MSGAAVSRLRERWDQAGIANPEPATEQALIEFEQRCGVRLGPVIREYFSVLNGTKNGHNSMEDEATTSFWHLDQIGTGERRDAATLFVFADYIISCWVWSVQLSDDRNDPNPVFISTKGGWTKVADSFEEFLNAYADKNPEVLFPPTAPP